MILQKHFLNPWVIKSRSLVLKFSVYLTIALYNYYLKSFGMPIQKIDPMNSVCFQYISIKDACITHFCDK